MHSHFALVGWVSFMVFGLAYESIPRFSSKPLYSRKLGMWQFWLANIGLIGLSLSYPVMRMYMLKGKDTSDAILAVIIFGVIEVISCFIFIYNIWKSMDNQGSTR
jgi:cbb3-type cytochrome oxidase subunit 1